jgi:hypothetical protein
VQLAGATDPVENAPWPGTRSRVLVAAPARGPAPGSPLEISSAAIVAAARELLGGGAPPERGAGAAP